MKWQFSFKRGSKDSSRQKEEWDLNGTFSAHGGTVKRARNFPLEQPHG